MHIYSETDGRRILYAVLDLSSPESLEQYARRLEGKTVQDVLDLGIRIEDVSRDYLGTASKGRVGTIIEECFFGYKANSDSVADFPDAGVELKTTVLDIKKDGTPRAGERLSITMIPFTEEIEAPFAESSLWAKSQRMLIIFYERNRDAKHLQTIRYVHLFTPPEDDLRIIRDDYRTIQSYVMAGRAHELSESLTTYLGAATKGVTAEGSHRAQYMNPDVLAKARSFSLKQSYVNHILNEYVIGGKKPDEQIIKPGDLESGFSFEDVVSRKLAPYIGKTAREIAVFFGLKYTGNKAQWTTLTYRMLGIKGNQSEEFLKAGINVRTVRIESDGKLKESLSFSPFSFKNLMTQEWERSDLYEFLESTRFFFVVFERRDNEEVLLGSRFWSMPAADLEGPVRDCWNQIRKMLSEGVELTAYISKDGDVKYRNNLPKTRDNRVAHVRPHSTKRAYRIPGSPDIGNVERDGSELPDGRWMTKQSFWLNASYVAGILKEIQ